MRIKRSNTITPEYIYHCYFTFTNEKIIKHKKQIKVLGNYDTSYRLDREKEIIDKLVRRLHLKDVTNVDIKEITKTGKPFNR